MRAFGEGVDGSGKWLTGLGILACGFFVIVPKTFSGFVNFQRQYALHYCRASKTRAVRRVSYEAV
jgi:hypothetical protein